VLEDMDKILKYRLAAAEYAVVTATIAQLVAERNTATEAYTRLKRQSISEDDLKDLQKRNAFLVKRSMLYARVLEKAEKQAKHDHTIIGELYKELSGLYLRKG